MLNEIRYRISQKRESHSFPWKIVFYYKDRYDKIKIKFGQRRERILIVGCGRSGTKYIATLLTKMGLPIGHEYMRKYGIASWPFVFDTDEIPPYTSNLRFKDYKYKVILHQVRYPLDVIRSFHTVDPKSHVWAFIKRYIPNINESDSQTLKCMKYWYYWNLEAEKISSWTYRVENLYNDFDIFCDQIKHPELIKKKHIVKELTKNVNTRKGNTKIDYWQITWEDLKHEDSDLCEKIKILAEKYGYDS